VEVTEVISYRIPAFKIETSKYKRDPHVVPGRGTRKTSILLKLTHVRLPS